MRIEQVLKAPGRACVRRKSRNWPLHRGGVSGWLRGAAITSAAGIRMSTHLYPEMAAHLMRVTDTAHSQEWQDWARGRR